MHGIKKAAAGGLVAATILALAACGTSTGSGAVGGATGSPLTSPAASPQTSAAASTAPSAAPSAAASGPALNQILLQFTELNASKITGGAILTDLGDGQTAVTIGVVAAGVTEPMPAEIVPGTCADLGTAPSPATSPAASASLSAIAPITLADLAAGASNTVIDITVDDLLASSHAIVIHRSPTDAAPVACGHVTR